MRRWGGQLRARPPRPVRPGGVLAVEDADFDGLFCDPPNEGFDFYWRTMLRLVERRGGDATHGRKLRRHFLEAGIPDPSWRRGWHPRKTWERPLSP
jgi:hypothetical protein